MRVAFDGTALRPGRTGVGHYTEHLLQHLAQAGSPEAFVVVSNRPVDTTRPLPPGVKVAVSSLGLPRTVWMQTSAPRMLRRLGVDVVHFTDGMVPVASPVPTVVTIHDASVRMYPWLHSPRRVWLNRWLVDLAVRRADAIITVSHSTKRDVVRLHKIDAERVHVVYEAAAPSFHPISDLRELERVRQRYSLADRYILYVGTIEPRKNLSLLIEGFAKGRKRGDLPHQLVCAGPCAGLSPELEDVIERLQVEGAIRFTGYVPVDDLAALYNLAEMFVCPSIYEGFGLPVVEAMACGTPVITGHVPALDEVAGGAVAQVERLDAESLCGAMVALAQSRPHRETLRTLGLRRARAFSWDRAARETLGVYRQAASGKALESARASAAYHPRTPW